VKRLTADGADVAITYANDARAASEVVEAIKPSGGKGLAIQADAADPAAVTTAVEQTVMALGGLDIFGKQCQDSDSEEL
jgi:3-oxoacyl-[acyl-carrier protein] reductase